MLEGTEFVACSWDIPHFLLMLTERSSKGKKEKTASFPSWTESLEGTEYGEFSVNVGEDREK